VYIRVAAAKASVAIKNHLESMRHCVWPLTVRDAATWKCVNPTYPITNAAEDRITAAVKRRGTDKKLHLNATRHAMRLASQRAATIPSKT